MKINHITITAVLLASCLTAAAQTPRSDEPRPGSIQEVPAETAPAPAPLRAPRGGAFGIGAWRSHGNGEDTPAGVSLDYATDRFLVSAGYDAVNGRMGYLLMGPGFTVTAFKAGERAAVRIPLHAVCGVTDFTAARFDYGASAAVELLTRPLLAGMRIQYTRHTAALTLLVSF